MGRGLTGVCPGAKMTGFFGNFFLRGQDLLAVPNCTADSTFVIEVSHEDEQSVKDAVYCQTALLYAFRHAIAMRCVEQMSAATQPRTGSGASEYIIWPSRSSLALRISSITSTSPTSSLSLQRKVRSSVFVLQGRPFLTVGNCTAVEVLLSKSLVASRELIQQSCISLLSGWRKSSGVGRPSHLVCVSLSHETSYRASNRCRVLKTIRRRSQRCL